MRWTSKITVLDVETGEELDKRKVDNGSYVVLKKTTKTRKIDELNGERTIIWHCERSRQLGLFNDGRC